MGVLFFRNISDAYTIIHQYTVERRGGKMNLVKKGQLPTKYEMQIVKKEKKKTNEENENFFNLEEKLLNHLFRSEKKEAQQVVKVVLNYVTARTEINKFEAVKYYLITLSSVVARKLEKTSHSASKAFDFNLECFTLIAGKLNENNIIELANDLIEFYTHVLSDKKQPALMHSTVNNVIMYINENVETSMTVEEVAKRYSISTSHLSRIFREHTGTTLVEYITIRKVEESQYYLRFSEEKIASISDKFHFCNQSYFTRMFKKYTGQTPRRFRSSWRGEYFRYNLPMEEN